MAGSGHSSRIFRIQLVGKSRWEIDLNQDRFKLKFINVYHNFCVCNTKILQNLKTGLIQLLLNFLNRNIDGLEYTKNMNNF